MSSVSIIVPTYNEAENIEPLLTRLQAAFADNWADQYHIHLVDDGSTDGTVETARAVSEAHAIPLSTHVRSDGNDLSASILRGLREATGDICLVLDGDLQHPPETGPDLVAAIETGADIAIGTRRAASGTDNGLNPTRSVVSRGGELLSYLALPNCRTVSDPMSGFFAVRTSLLDLSTLTPHGYKLLLELLETHPHATVTEVGFTFHERHAGESNLTAGEVLKFLEHLFLARWRRTPAADRVPAEWALQSVEVAAVGIGVFALNTGIVALADTSQQALVVSGILAVLFMMSVVGRVSH